MTEGRSGLLLFARGYALALIVATVCPLAAQALTRDELNLIQKGFELFTTETFDGNGRSCGTCHLPEKNYNISPADIAELSDAKKALVLASSVPNLENPTLVEKLALFNINEEHAPGGGNTPVGPFRGSMTIAGVAFTTQNDFCSVPNTGNLVALTQCGSISTVPSERSNEAVNDGTRRVALGWAGDGGAGLDPEIFPDIPASKDCIDAVNAAAADPTDLTANLRAFSLGAVRTHNTLRLDRIPGIDFRCPTATELDALAAFQKWLGRRIELDLMQLTFVKDPSEGPGPGLGEEGKALFLNDLATCNRCHFNAGANGSLGRVLQPEFTSDDPHPPAPAPLVPGAAKNSHTSTDLLRVADVVLNNLVTPVAIPRDSGDKRLRGGVQADGERAGGFNMQSLIEAPRKRAFFHNSAFVTDVESAASFYFSPTFDASQGGSGRVAQTRYCALPGNTCPNQPTKRLLGPGALAGLGGGPALNKLGFFLRALSAVYSLADCERLVEEMIERTNLGMSTALPALHCQFALDDVAYVLTNAKVPLPLQYQALLQRLPGIKTNLEIMTVGNIGFGSGGASGSLMSLPSILANLRYLRASIATSPQLVIQPIVGAPALGFAASGVLVVALFGFSIVRLRRRSR
jgi:cytochrome c peroxidase